MPLFVARDANSLPVNTFGFADINTTATSFRPSVSLDSGAATYRAVAVDFAPVATPTDWLMIQGGSRTARIKKIAIGGGATAAGSMIVQLVRRSSQYVSLGTAVFSALTAAKHDTTDPNPSVVVSTIGTANLTTVGTTAGVLDCARVTMVAIGSAATSGEGKPLVFADGPTRSSKSWVLRGTNDFIFINGNGAGIPSGGKFDVVVEWEEDITS